MKKEELFKAETFDYICNLIKQKVSIIMKETIKQVWITEIKVENFTTDTNEFEKELSIKFSMDLDREDFSPRVFIDAVWYYSAYDAQEFASIVTDNILKALTGRKSVAKIDITEQDKNSEIFSVCRKTIMDK